MKKLLTLALALYCGALLAIPKAENLADVTDALESGDDVIIVLVTPWCSICKAKSFTSVLDAYENKYPQARMLIVDAEKLPKVETFLLKRCKLRKKDLGYPTTLTFKKGKKHQCIIGTTSVAELERALDNEVSVVKRKKKKSSKTCPVVSTQMIYPKEYRE